MVHEKPISSTSNIKFPPFTDRSVLFFSGSADKALRMYEKDLIKPRDQYIKNPLENYMEHLHKKCAKTTTVGILNIMIFRLDWSSFLPLTKPKAMLIACKEMVLARKWLFIGERKIMNATGIIWRISLAFSSYIHKWQTYIDPFFQVEEIIISKDVTSISQGKKEMRKQFLRWDGKYDTRETCHKVILMKEEGRKT